MMPPPTMTTDARAGSASVGVVSGTTCSKSCAEVGAALSTVMVGSLPLVIFL
jgi:hypothetical protein